MFSLSQKTGRTVFLIGLIVFTNWLHSKFLEHKENIIENPFKSGKRRFPRINSQLWRVQTDEAKTKTSIGPEVIEEHRHQEWGYEKFIIQLCERPRTYIFTTTHSYIPKKHYVHTWQYCTFH